MAWNDIAYIIVVCTAANHLGLVSAVEKFFRHRIPIVNCTKCSTFWSVLTYSLICRCATTSIPEILALSFLASYAAIWLELFMAVIDTIYEKIYGTIYKEHENEAEGD